MTTEISSRSKVRQWVRESIEGREEVRIPDLVNEAVKVFNKDRKFLTALANETLRDMVYELARTAVGNSRLITLGDEAVNLEGVKRRARTHSVFASWLEHAGDHHVRLLDMTREDLLVAADEREKRGQHEVRLAALWRTIANGLEGGQTVGSKYTAEEIEDMQAGLDHA